MPKVIGDYVRDEQCRHS